MKNKRDELDRYYTPKFLTKNLLIKLEEKNIKLQGLISEPCCGKGFISNVLKEQNYNVITNDLDPNVEADSHYDTSKIAKSCDWVITNPPFKLAHEMLPILLSNANLGLIALLRLSYLEPCLNRRNWLIENKPNYLFINKRISFTNNGKSDSCTTAWVVWLKNTENETIDFIF